MGSFSQLNAFRKRAGISYSYGPEARRTKYRRRNQGYKTRYGNRSYGPRRTYRRPVRRISPMYNPTWRSLKQMKVTRWRSDSTEHTLDSFNQHLDRFDFSFDVNNVIWKGLEVMGGSGYNKLYDECRLLSTKMFIKLSDPGEVYSGTAAEINDIVLYTCYDPDSRQRNFDSVRSFLNVEHTKKHNWTDLRKEYSFRFYPKWDDFQMKQDNEGTLFRSRTAMKNPWWDIGALGGTYPDFPENSCNALQWALVAAQGVKFKVRFEHVIGYRGVRNGQTYASAGATSNKTSV